MKKTSSGYLCTIAAINVVGNVVEIFPSSAVSARVPWFVLVAKMRGFKNWPQIIVSKNYYE